MLTYVKPVLHCSRVLFSNPMFTPSEFKVNPLKALLSTTDQFGGIHTTPESLPSSPVEFRKQLCQSLEYWSTEGFKLVWLHIGIAKSNLIPIAVESGFSFHHTGNNHLMLVRPIVKGAFIPPYASHYIGAGGVVVNHKDELLVVQEKREKPDTHNFYKLPGGTIHSGEHIVKGVIREVLEETGISTSFDALVCLRNIHGYRHDKSDIYFVCRLKPQTHKISMQPEEIEECLWMPLDQYFNSTSVSTFNKSIVQTSLENPGFTPTIIEGYRDPEQVEIFLPSDFV